MIKRLLATIAVAATLCAPASGATINFFTSGSQDDIPGLTGFTTFGDQMDGMQVTACFSTAGCQTTLVWADTGAGSGGVTGTGWSLSVSGDTFAANAWSFVFGPNNTLGQLVSLLLDGGPYTLFDRTNPNPGTNGSASGRDFNTADGVIDVTYIDQVAVTPNAPVGDIYHSMSIVYVNGTGPRSSFLFSQDADNDLRLTAPEPTSLALLGIAGLGLALARRRRRS
jgi:PEP-CTERM motif